ncbi:MAG TPA: rhomboid family intramembrane serine protease [Zoogloea sp.]|uniref:rhomboid family intramembrane serine protease n=1 Tax=Zoogloea sp. TaxID=49181 RepID=UPI002C9C7A88|nr:rhomboid family intramembrane serine protease [Zoogloea sp.]HOB45869.1 rhomboid family intramembrane serine protease [Zoogloea sp.]HQA10928.1 rhomboid family intramembrane serine protease [Zoogloea sp.]
MNQDTFINILFSRVERAAVTRALVFVNAGIFVLLAVVAMNPMQIPSDLLIRAGGNFAPLVQKGEEWRLFTALFLHGGLLHVGLNMLALHQAGQVVERLFGRVGFLVIYVAAGLLGNLASLWWKPGPVSVGASGAIFGVYGALLSYLLLQRGSVPVEIFREMRSGTLGFIGYSLFAGFSIPGIDNAAHLGGLIGGMVLGAAFAQPIVAPQPVRWLTPRTLTGLAVVAVLGAGLWQTAPQVVRKFEIDSAYQQTIQQFALEEQELLREQAALMEALRLRRVSEADAIDRLERDFIPRWDREINQLSWRQAPAGQDWQRDDLVHYATARRDALKALVQALETRQAVWIERSRTLQVQADNILLQMRLRKSTEAANR